jgi:predicted SnoaL-like aldol condensation-catalyzing enzyme
MQSKGGAILSMEDNKARVRRFFEKVVSQGNLETVDELLAASCRYFDAGILRTTGCSEFIDYLIQARKPLDSINVKIDNMIAEGDQVAVRCSYHLIIEGEHSMVPVMADFRLKDGKIVEMWRTVAARD